jgi:hypothetical protein
MKLLELYALATGLQIGHQHFAEAFYPLPFDRYITVQTGSGMPAKNYPYYNEVFYLMRNYLAANDIHVVQLGGEKDSGVAGAYSLLGKTTLYQSNYVLTRSLLHIGNDSWMAHRAGAVQVPLVALYGPTTKQNHAPYDHNSEITALIESHRFGKLPTFQSVESPASIAVIPPEQVAREALRLLSAQIGVSAPTITRRSIYIGPDYHAINFEIVPDMAPNAAANVGVPAIRMDLDASKTSEQWLAQNLSMRRCAVITDREINLNILAQFRPNLVGMRLFVDKLSPQWIKAVTRLGVPLQTYCRERDPQKVSELRLKLFDACFFDVWHDADMDDLRKGTLLYLGKKELDMEPNWCTLSFRTNHYLLSKGSIYLSTAHWRAGQKTEAFEKNIGRVIDTPEFWSGQKEHYYFEV